MSNYYSNNTHVNIKWKILEKNENEQAIIVRYWTDMVSQEDLRNASENLPDGTPVRCVTDYNINIWHHLESEEEVQKHIEQCAPVAYFALKHKVKDPNRDSSLSIIDKMMNKTNEILVDSTPPKRPEPPKQENNQSNKELTDEEIEKLLESITSKDNNKES